MNEFYGAPSGADTSDEQARLVGDALFSEPPSSYALLAFGGSTLAGLASYSFLWPAEGLTSSLYLKELYISESWRGTGVGRTLMRSLIKIAAERDCSRLEWTTDIDNSGAQAFYESLGAPKNSSKIFYRLDGERLRRAME
jgi:GNAT superfamily N-acetyltransferase